MRRGRGALLPPPARRGKLPGGDGGAAAAGTAERAGAAAADLCRGRPRAAAEFLAATATRRRQTRWSGRAPRPRPSVAAAGAPRHVGWRERRSGWAARPRPPIASFQSIVLDIPKITMPEKIDRYSRGLKSYIWEALCTKQYDTVEALMLDALKVEAAKRGSYRGNEKGNAFTAAASKYGPAPIDISALPMTRLTPEERKRCMRDGL